MDKIHPEFRVFSSKIPGIPGLRCLGIKEVYDLFDNPNMFLIHFLEYLDIIINQEMFTTLHKIAS